MERVSIYLKWKEYVEIQNNTINTELILYPLYAGVDTVTTKSFDCTNVVADSKEDS